MKEIKQDKFVQSMLINKEEIVTAKTTEVYNPAKLTEVVGTVCMGNETHVKKAVLAAEASAKEWAQTEVKQRANYLLTLAEYIEENLESLTQLLTREHGKILTQAKGDLLAGREVLRYYASLTDELKDRIVENEQGTLVLKRQPVGVVSIIVPWNYPIVLALLMLAPSLLAGNTVVIKPPTYVPLTLTRILTALVNDLPKGVLNVVLGNGGTVGTEMVKHPRVRKVAFTGSTETGRNIMRDAADTIKKVTMELGGNDAALILPNAIIDKQFINEFIQATLTASGQICYSMKRIYVHQSQYDEFVQKYTEGVDKTVVGNGLDPETTMGPVNNKAQYEVVQDLINKAKKSGATVSAVGKLGNSVSREDGYYILPTVVTNLNGDEDVVQCEQFGPVVPIVSYQDVDDVIMHINNTEFGLGNSVWTSDVDYGFEIASRFESGSVFVNTHRLGASAVNMPFGGFKQSGIGRGHGVEALHEHTELQALIHRTDM